MSLRSFLAKASPAIFICLLAILIRLWLFIDACPAVYWDTPSYLSYAEFLVANQKMPGIGMRTFAYPLFIVLSGGGKIILSSTMYFQLLLGVLCTGLVTLMAELLLGRRGAWLVGVLYLFAANVIFMEVTIYSETLAQTFLLGGLYLFLRRLVLGGGDFIWFLSGVLLGLATLVRPVFQVVLFMAVVYALLCVLRPLITKSRFRFIFSFLEMPLFAIKAKALLCLIVGPIILVGGLCLHNHLSGHAFRLALGKGYSSLNYVGYPEIYHELPPSLDHVREVYEQIAQKRDNYNSFVGWGEAIKEVMAARSKAGYEVKDWDQAAFAVTKQVFIANPFGYLRIWLRVLHEYLTQYVVWFGLYPSHEVPQGGPEHAQISGLTFSVVKALEAFWQFLQPFISYLAFFSPFLLLVFGKVLEEKRQLALWILASVFMATTCANTIVESAPGQGRYRMPWEGIILVLSVSMLILLVKACCSLFTSSSCRRFSE